MTICYDYTTACCLLLFFFGISPNSSQKPPSLNPTDPSLPVQQFILFTLFLHPTSPAMIKLLCRVMVIDMLLFKYIMFPNVGNGHSPRCHESLHSVAWTSF